MRGAVAAGSPLTVEAGLHALRAGGNAVDAAIASTLMAGVAEPLLTGLGGAGMATVRMNGEVIVCDMFANVPGLGEPPPAEIAMETVTIDFGPTTQSFLVGPAAVAVPGLPGGLIALHGRFGSVPLPFLAQPAVDAAKQGVEVLPGFERVCSLLWPILARSAAVAERLGRDGRPLRAGEVYRAPDLGETIAEFAASGGEYFETGEGAKALAGFVAGSSRLGPADMAHYQAAFHRPLHLRYQDADIYVPGPPSMAGMVVLQLLENLGANGLPEDPFSSETVDCILSAMRGLGGYQTPAFYAQMFSEGFPEAFIRHGRNGGGMPSTQPGLTTHISTVDEHGNVVAITHSLGETCGEMVPGTGMLVNNFLGEEDVNPSHLQRSPGSRLVTMCCPTIIRRGDAVFAMGSGGSNRIPTAILHGAIYLVDHSLPVDAAVSGPRVHLDEGRVHIESAHRTEPVLAMLDKQHPKYVRFDGPNMYFGGLHVAGQAQNGFVGSGDARRSGAFGTTG